jgi:DNA-binding NarL/FixJ family response regulator
MNRRRRTSSARKSRRSTRTTRSRARKTTTRRFSGTNKVWTRSEIATLRKIYRTNSNMDIAKKLGRSEGSVQYKASSLGLRKSASYLKQIRNNWS